MTRRSPGNGRVRGWLALALTFVALVGPFPGTTAAAVGRVSHSGTVGDSTVATAVDAASSRLSCAAGAAACPIRIRFARGAYSGQAHGHLGGIHDEQWFVVRASVGQEMIVIVKGPGSTRGTVYFPNGQQDGQPGGRVFDDSLPVSGDYRIRVTESLMGEAWAGRVDVLVVIY